jgi:8-oxo-dGTP diphosphatase
MPSCRRLVPALVLALAAARLAAAPAPDPAGPAVDPATGPIRPALRVLARLRDELLERSLSARYAFKGRMKLLWIDADHDEVMAEKMVRRYRELVAELRKIPVEEYLADPGTEEALTRAIAWGIDTAIASKHPHRQGYAWIRRILTGYQVEDGKLLLLRRANPPNLGLWSPPGGKVEPCESPRECMVREWEEETGLRPVRLELAGVLSQFAPGHYDVNMFFYRILAATGTLRASEAGPLEWVPLGEVFSRPIPEADRLFAPWILDPGTRFVEARFLQDAQGRVLEPVVHERIPR